eukprot:scaffold660540_cov42-Prasinocladus_malaysianus.AAC.1
MVIIPRLVNKGKSDTTPCSVKELQLISNHWTAAASPDVFLELSETLSDASIFIFFLVLWLMATWVPGAVRAGLEGQMPAAQ